MRRRIALLTIAAGLLVSFWVAPACAQTYISGTGSDLNDCSRNTPCRSFQIALAKTANGGQIDCLDGLGTNSLALLDITQSVTINCAAVAATVFHSNVPPAGITIDVPGGFVHLRGLNVNGQGVGKRGIEILNAKSVVLEDMEITNETQQGIVDVRPNGGLLLIKNSLIARAAGAGIAIATTGGPFGATLENVRSFNNAFGLAVGSGNNVMLIKSVLSGNSIAGLEMHAGAQVTLDNSIANFNPTGLQSSGFLTLMGSTISYNNTAIIGASSSFGDNKIYSNGSPGTAPTVGAASTDHSKQ